MLLTYFAGIFELKAMNIYIYRSVYYKMRVRMYACV